jgi:hypothetical protein
MGRVGRLAGALLAETSGAYYLVGNPKVPCDWRAVGFEHPGELDARVRPVVPLVVIAGATPPLGEPQLIFETEGETEGEIEGKIDGDALAKLLVDAFVIPRTGSVSERLWRLVIGESDESDAPVPAVISARWLAETPPHIWAIVRDTVLRCT